MSELVVVLLAVVLLDGSRDGVVVVFVGCASSVWLQTLLGPLKREWGCLDEVWRETSVVVEGGGVTSHSVSAVELPCLKTEPPSHLTERKRQISHMHLCVFASSESFFPFTSYCVCGWQDSALMWFENVPGGHGAHLTSFLGVPAFTNTNTMMMPHITGLMKQIFTYCIKWLCQIDVFPIETDSFLCKQ